MDIMKAGKIKSIMLVFCVAVLFISNGCREKGGHSMSEERSAENSENKGLEKAMFGAGCFWGVEALFLKVPGVIDAASGYSGGHTENPNYEEVCTDKTGHAEVVEVIFDSGKVSYGDLVEFFWSIHDPTTLNRQGPDVGTQYRSAIFFYDAEQERIAIESKTMLEQSGKYKLPVVTEIPKVSKFWRAEEYHQRYIEKHPGYVCPLIKRFGL
jgi:peptide-methionine (S)-S-oxide reductase